MKIHISYYPNNLTDYSYTFDNVTHFKNFIDECHKQISKETYDNFITFYNNIMAENTTNKDVIIYTTINGDNLYYSKYHIHIKEIIQQLKTTQQLITNNLVTIINCNQWKYSTIFREGKPFTTIWYTVDKENPINNNCQIHAYKNMIITYSKNNTLPHVINTKEYNIIYKDKMPQND